MPLSDYSSIPWVYPIISKALPGFISVPIIVLPHFYNVPWFFPTSLKPTFLIFCPCSYSIARFSPMSPESCPRSYSQGSTNFKNSSSQQNILVARKIYLFSLPFCPHIYTHNLLSGPYFKFNHWSSKSTKVFVNNWNGIVTSIV